MDRFPFITILVYLGFSAVVNTVCKLFCTFSTSIDDEVMYDELMKSRFSFIGGILVAKLFLLGAATASVPPQAEAVLVVITGLGGEPRFEERFSTWTTTLAGAAGDRGLAQEQIYTFTGTEARRENVLAALSKLADSMAENAPLFMAVIGHGSFRDGVTKVNLPGPDMTTADFANVLDRFGQRPVVFAALTSASGGMVEALSAPGRVVIAATRSGKERNASIFGQHFAAAFVGQEADLDNDGRLSILEAFLYAHREVSRDYDREQRLLTEHAVLDDNGDGKGTSEPTADGVGDGADDSSDGKLAATLFLAGSQAQGEADEEKARLTQLISDLRSRKATMSPEEYEAQLEELLIELALVHRAKQNK